MEFLNLGCGPKYVKSKEWVNADMLPCGEDVLQCNFLDGIPYKSGRFDLVYHSHVLEHFAKADGEKFIAECYRILKPGGIIRIAMPNLEVMAKEYLKNIEKGMANENKASIDYDWIMLEMYDQTVRNKSGGCMWKYLTQKNMENEEYVYDRIGWDAKKWRQMGINSQDANPNKLASVLQKIRKQPLLIFKGLKHLYLRLVLSKKGYQYYKVGAFRFGGEIHQWMYDRYSLGRLLKQVGFDNIQLRKATTSYIDNWSDYKLDDTRETASIFIEAIK